MRSLLLLLLSLGTLGAQPLPGTGPLTWTGDIASNLVAGIDRFLLERIDAELADPAHAARQAEAVREGLTKRLGLDRDQRAPLGFEQPVHAMGLDIEEASARMIRWRAFRNVHGEGYLVTPTGKIERNVILIVDPDTTQEHHILTALTLAANGCRVLMPDFVNRKQHPRWKMSKREWLHRPAFELGRTLIGYEVQMVLAAVDVFEKEHPGKPVGVAGHGTGGLVAMYAAALDERIDATLLSGCHGSRRQLWQEPADHNVFGLLRGFDNPQVVPLCRGLVVEDAPPPTYHYRANADGLEVANRYTGAAGKPGRFLSEKPSGPCMSGRAAFDKPALEGWLGKLGVNQVKHLPAMRMEPMAERTDTRLMRSIEEHNQWALQDSPRERAVFMKDLDTSSLAAFEASQEPYRKIFREEVIGHFDLERLPPNPRSRRLADAENTVSYEVVMDVFTNVFAYGILTLPKNLKLDGSDPRPVVVCQHGLEGRPQDVIGEQNYKAYKAFATRLAERGFVTFAPQNCYIGYDRFRTLQFKAQSIGRTLFSVMVPQHEQLTDWLAAQPFVDGERIGFYGLSYGGKSAMRIPPLVPRYCLSICSADFNDWVWKNAATDPASLRYSYANKGEYEIFEWNLGGTFNYSEMAALIAPRPFMVERGHFDGVAPDERVGLEFAKVRHLYAAKLGIGERCEIEWFVGPHTIHGVGTFDFLHRHLDWPGPRVP